MRGAELVVVAAPIAQLPGAGRRRCSRAAERRDGHRRRLDEGARLRGRGRLAALRRRPSDLRAPRRAGRSTRSADLFDGATWFLTPRRARPTRIATGSSTASSPTLGATPVAIDAGRARPPRRADEPRAARARERRRQPGRRRARRGPRAARARRRLAARHDARRRREPADLGRHLPRQRGSRSATRSPSTAGASSRSRRRSTQGDAGFLARWIGEAAANRRRMLERDVPRRGRAAAAARPRARPARRARRDHAGARRRADQHRGLRAPARLARARRHADAARRRARARRSAPRRCSRRRATASSSRRCSDEDRAGRVARAATSPSPATSRSRIARCCSARSRTARRAIRGFGRSADTESTLAAVRALGVRVDEDGDDAARPRRRPARPPAPASRSTAATPARSRACCRGCSPVQDGTFDARPATSRSRRRPMERIAEPLRRMGARVETTDGHAAADDRRAAPLTADRLRAAGRERAGEVGGAARRALRERAGRRSIEPAPTRDHTELMLAAAGVARRAAAAARSASTGRAARARSTSTSPATSPRRRRSSSRRRCSPGSRSTHPRRQPQPAAHRACSTCSSGWARGSPSSTGARVGGEPVGDLEVRSRRARRDDDRARRRCRCSSTSCRSSRSLAAWRAARASVGGAEELRAKETDRIEAVVDALRALGVAHRARRRTASSVRGVPSRPRGGTVDAARRPPDRDARRGRRPRLARGRRDRGRRGGRGKLPRLLRPPRLA